MKREKRDLSRTFKKGMGRIQKGAGFTLIELMVVVVIIGILAAVALPRFMVQQRKAKEGTGWADLDSMTTACEMYYLDTDTYPKGEGATTKSTTVGLQRLIVNTDTLTNWAGPYMKFRRISGATANWPKDPWGNDYAYSAVAATTGVAAYTVWCAGGVYDTTTYSAYYINSGLFKSP